METTLSEVKAASPKWFSESNRKFFGDLRYFVFNWQDRSFLIRKTNAWTDMFDSIPKPHYRINSIKDNLKIGEFLSDIHFKSMKEAILYVKEEVESEKETS